MEILVYATILETETPFIRFRNKNQLSAELTEFAINSFL